MVRRSSWVCVLVVAGLVGLGFWFARGTAVEQGSVTTPATATTSVSPNTEVVQENRTSPAGITSSLAIRVAPRNDGKLEETGVVERVIDGDTVALADGRTVRYLGVDTPEIAHASTEEKCFGVEAAARNVELVLEKNVRLIRDVSGEDRYGRLLRYVYAGGVFVNEALAREGFAKVIAYPPDTAQTERLRDAEREARANRRGLWDACGS